ncbi:class I SAM-dependent DNA methyltransferase [Candidatus Mesenet endosymbiont of Agriotes lineatus]|uniref:class I SAM-dependent DNA methyltransferase n=1 Tax=Candidatus Mesenet endosymbiont of Agriotes lineatus TaxID=3077948 RepID=UPI0030CDC76E
MRSNVSLIKETLVEFMSTVYNLILSIKNTLTKRYYIFFKELRIFNNKVENLLNTNIELGLYHFYKSNISEAKFRFLLINIFFRNLSVLQYNIGRCNFASGNISKAYDNFLNLLKIDANHEEALYYIKKIKNPSSIDYIPDSIIQQYFDYTGEYFIEHWLVAKQYRGYEFVYMLIKKFMNDRLLQLNILDLGCGTGVCGQFLKVYGIGNYIVGIDISNRMLNIARGCFVNGTLVYNELINIEMKAFLKKDQDLRYDVILLIEVLNYVGNFASILERAGNLLNKNGVIICSVRKKSGVGFEFVNEGDFFRHSEEYVRSIVLNTNMKISCMSYCKMYGNQVDGILFVIQLKN